MRQRYGTPSHFRESIRAEGVNASGPHRFIYKFPLFLHANTVIFYDKKDSWHNIGTKFADFLRHIMQLKFSFRIWFGVPFVFMHREGIQTVGGRRR